MPEQLLDEPQVRPSLEHVRGGTVPQPVGAKIRRSRHVGEQCVQGGTDLSRVGTPPTPAEEQCRPAL